MHKSFAHRASCLLTILAACLLLNAFSENACAQDLETSTEQLPPPTDDLGNPFDDSLSDEEESTTEQEDLFDDEPNQLVLDEDEFYEDGPYYDDQQTFCLDGGCGAPVCMAPCRSCGWYKAGYVFGWSKGVDAPPLATSSPAGTDPNQAGVLGDPNTDTSILFGDSGILGNLRGGGQFELGYWLDPSHTAALELSYFFLGEMTDDFFGDQDNFPILARPFLNVETGLQDSQLIAFDNLIEGSLSIATSTSLHTSVLAYRNQLYGNSRFRVDYLLGYRFAYLGDSVDIRESTLALDGSSAPGTTINLLDSFETRNMFHGGEFGFEVQREIDHCWNCAFNARIALGGSGLEANIQGHTVTDDGTTTTTRNGGLLTQDSNTGSYRDTEFNTVSNIGLTFRRRVLANTSLSFGYQFFLWSHVWRAADQIDTNVNPTQIDGTLVGAALPAFPGANDSYWAQGVTINLEGRF